MLPDCSILTPSKHFDGSFKRFCDAFLQIHGGKGTALQLAKMIVDTFPSFRDEAVFDGEKCMCLNKHRISARLTTLSVCFWKRAQILVAETWAAFYPGDTCTHPLFPVDATISELTMFADYRVPQILHHLRTLDYPPSLVKKLLDHDPFAPGCKEEISIRAASIVAVERVRQQILRLKSSKKSEAPDGDVSSVLIDFYLWDLAKRIEVAEDVVKEIETTEPLPIHRTRSIWY